LIAKLKLLINNSVKPSFSLIITMFVSGFSAFSINLRKNNSKKCGKGKIKTKIKQ
jgi:hypothetical protein